MPWKTSSLWLFFCFHVFLIGQSSAQGLSSCDGRCGETYSREAPCQCDYNCDVFFECCSDFKKVCTSELSCKGRCHEKFERGRECDCDNNCGKYDKCCSDFREHCKEPTENQTPSTAKPSTTSQTPTKVKKHPPKKPKETLDKKKPKKETKPKEKTKGDSEQPSPPADRRSTKKPSPESPKQKKPGKVETGSPGNEDNPVASADGKTAENPSSKPKKRKRPGDSTNPDEEAAGDPEHIPSDSTGEKTPKEQSPKPPKKKRGHVTASEGAPAELSDDPLATLDSISSAEGRKSPTKRSPKPPKKPGASAAAQKDKAKTTKKKNGKKPKEEEETEEIVESENESLSESSSSSSSASHQSSKDFSRSVSKILGKKKKTNPGDNPKKGKTTTASPKKKKPKTTTTEPKTTEDAEGEGSGMDLSTTMETELSTTGSTTKKPYTQSTLGTKTTGATSTVQPLRTSTTVATSTRQQLTTTTTKETTTKHQQTTTSTGRTSTKQPQTTTVKNTPTTEQTQTTTGTKGTSTEQPQRTTTTEATTSQPPKITTENATQMVTTVKPQTSTPSFHLPETSPMLDFAWYTTPTQEQTKPATRSTPRTYPIMPTTNRPIFKSTTLTTETATTILPSTKRTTTKPAFVFEWTTEARRVPQSSTSATPHPCPASVPGSGQKRTAVPPLPNMCPTTTTVAEKVVPCPASMLGSGQKRTAVPPLPNMCPTTTTVAEKVTPKRQNIMSYLPGIQIVNASLLKDEMNLCNGRPVDGMTTLQNGSLVAFRDHYFWTLNQFGRGAESPRRITDVWGVPSPIDTVFTRCNCEGKTFFFKDSSYWRFTNGAMDTGYPKLITKGFGGLSGRPTAVLSVAAHKKRVESVYFFKSGGSVQQYTYKQEPQKKCDVRTQPKPHYPVYTHSSRNGRFRTVRDVFAHTIVRKRTYSTVRNVHLNLPSKGVLHAEMSVRTAWRGIPNDIVSAVSLPHPQKPDGYDYFVFSKDKYYNLNPSSRTAMKLPGQEQQNTSKDWYKCPEESKN